MRIIPDQPRLRVVALTCWVLGCWCLVEAMRLLTAPTISRLLALGVVVLALLAFAVGVAFWLIGTDRHAGITFDAKGVLLNLGHSSAFISWQNIRRVGVTRQRASLLALGSARQIGIELRDVTQYFQTYEERLPAARGPLSGAVRLIRRLLHGSTPTNDQALRAATAHSRARTGYDLVIPEALLGGRAELFADLVDSYRLRAAERG